MQESLISKKCPVCLKDFFRPKNIILRIWLKRRFCSNKCRGINFSSTIPKLSKKCLVCSMVFFRPKKVGFKLWSVRKFCSKKCHGIGVTGYKKGSTEGTRRMGLSRMGKNNPAWKGGITSENYRIRRGREFSEWRKLVFERDEYKCKKCSEIGGKLRPHHILSFELHKELRFAVDNGITLCHHCHKDFHDIYGYKNNTKEQINEYLKGGRNAFSCASFKRIIGRLQHGDKSRLPS